MSFSLPKSLKQRVEMLCQEYGYLKVRDPGIWFVNGDMTFVLVSDQKDRSLWNSLTGDSTSNPR
jgi:endo-1,4-beta-mannosidase